MQEIERRYRPKYDMRVRVRIPRLAWPVRADGRVFQHLRARPLVSHRRAARHRCPHRNVPHDAGRGRGPDSRSGGAWDASFAPSRTELRRAAPATASRFTTMKSLTSPDRKRPKRSAPRPGGPCRWTRISLRSRKRSRENDEAGIDWRRRAGNMPTDSGCVQFQRHGFLDPHQKRRRRISSRLEI
jgi:hypothetical protein